MNATIKELTERLKSKREECKKHQKLTEECEADIQALERSIRICENGNGKIEIDLVGKFQGMTQFQALKKMAQENKGYVRPTDAIPALRDAGLIKGKQKNAMPHLYNQLEKSDEFERIAPGTFRLKEGEWNEIDLDKDDITQAVKELKESNPQLTKGEIKKLLIAKNYNFQQKNPGRVVHLAWVRLGYAKREPGF